jgi:uncharacterized phage protein (TIGR02218 family)
VVSPSEFFGSGLAGFPDDFFAFGEIVFTSGDNANLPFKFVKSFDGVDHIVLAQSFYYPVEVGDQFLIRAGCRKRFDEDCRLKFGNALHFGGFPHVPQKSSVIKFGDQ